VHKVDWHPVDGAKAAVDAPDEFVDHGAQVLVLLDVLARRDRDLDEDDLADPLGVLLEEDLHGVELLRHALDVVEAVDADNELDVLEPPPQGRDALLHLFLLQRLEELSRLDPDRERADRRVAADELDLVRGALDTEEARARREEVPRVVVRVKPNEVAVEDAEEDFAPDGERAVTTAGARSVTASSPSPGPSSSRESQNTHRNTSEEGNGVWRKNPIWTSPTKLAPCVPLTPVGPCLRTPLAPSVLTVRPSNMALTSRWPFSPIEAASLPRRSRR